MEYSKEMKNRVKRAEGQIRGVLQMMEDEKDCKAIITQMAAVRSAVDRATAYVVAKNLENCLEQETETDTQREELIEEAVKMLVKSR
ncbi:metal-sensitive transcriptional regulator [Alteribacter natronophilus]|uniref:metal-sensitive transcriptional regulator n=1 Tax=Alteribacter natronophilus TaxID=2583810 RepID=UPI00110DFD81|nr:metal-sensitive transcriptional regulator [Alteribacter natronophilus]TMW72997.1 metal-sensitive transcriptional regulator [Alteribacter natronophilus]